jgi:hypothetical protein
MQEYPTRVRLLAFAILIVLLLFAWRGPDLLNQLGVPERMHVPLFIAVLLLPALLLLHWIRRQIEKPDE